MEPMAEEQLDYEDEEYDSSQKTQYHGGGAISALAEDEIIGEDDEYDDLYNDVNVGEGFLQLQQQQQSKPAPATSLTESQSQTNNIPQPKSESVNTQLPNVNISTLAMVPEIQPVNSGFRGQIPIPQQMNPVNESVGMLNTDSGGGPRGGVSQMPPNDQMVNNVILNEAHVGPPTIDTGATMLFVGELHWWTTDAEIESVLSQYGRVKEIKFFDERASGKSKGYCQVEFYESAAASACKEGMDGYVFNGRACVVAFASPMTIRQMGSSYANNSQAPPQTQPPGRKPFNDGGNGGGRGNGGNFSGSRDGGGGRNFGDGSGGGGRSFGRGGWGGRGGQGIVNRGPGGNFPVKGRGGGGGFGAKNMVNNNPQGAFGNPAFGGPPGSFMHPQGVMGAGFDPTYMGRGVGYGFPGPVFPGMMPQFPGVNPMGLVGVAPHVNPAFFGRGMGMMGATGMEGHHLGMWGGDISGGGGWGGGVGGGGEEQRTRESSYGGEDGGSEYGYNGEDGNDKAPVGGGGSGGNRSKERVSGREWSGSSEKRQYREDREQEPARERYESREHHSSRYKEEKDGGYREHSRQKERDFSYDDDYESRAHSSSRPRSRSRAAPDESDHRSRSRSRSRDTDYGKRRHLPSE